MEYNFEFDLTDRDRKTKYPEFVAYKAVTTPPVAVFSFPDATQEEKRDALSMIVDGFSQVGISPPVIKTRKIILCKVKMTEEREPSTLTTERHYRLWLLPQYGTINGTARQIGYWNIVFNIATPIEDVAERMRIIFETEILE